MQPWGNYFCSALPYISQFLLAVSVVMNVISVYVSLRDPYLRWESIFEGTVVGQGEVGGAGGSWEGGDVNIAPGLSPGPLAFMATQENKSPQETVCACVCFWRTMRTMLFYTLIAHSIFTCAHSCVSSKSQTLCAGVEGHQSKPSLRRFEIFIWVVPCPQKKRRLGTFAY